MDFSSPDSPAWTPLVDAAWKARACAYAPYSTFAVGAALLTEHGLIVAGCNVENASYPVAVCAERNAIGAAVVAGLRPGGLRALVVVAETSPLTPPCGACRQVLAEFAGALPILLANRSERALHHLETLLPHAFNLGVPPRHHGTP